MGGEKEMEGGGRERDGRRGVRKGRGERKLPDTMSRTWSALSVVLDIFAVNAASSLRFLFISTVFLPPQPPVFHPPLHENGPLISKPSPIVGHHWNPKYAHSIIVFVFFNGDSLATRTVRFPSLSHYLLPSRSDLVSICLLLLLGFFSVVKLLLPHNYCH